MSGVSTGRSPLNDKPLDFTGGNCALKDFHRGLSAAVDVHEDGAEGANAGRLVGAGNAEFDVGDGGADGGEELVAAEGDELGEAPFVAGDIAHQEGRRRLIAGDFRGGSDRPRFEWRPDRRRWRCRATVSAG